MPWEYKEKNAEFDTAERRYSSDSHTEGLSGIGDFRTERGSFSVCEVLFTYIYFNGTSGLKE